MPHILAELSPWDPVSSARVTVRASSAQLREITGLNGQKWPPAIYTKPTKTIRLFDGDFSSDIDLGDCSLVLLTSWLKKGAPNFDRYKLAGAPITIYSGETTTAWPWPVFFKGIVDRFELVADQLKLVAKVDTEPFEANALTATYAGTTGIEGDANLKNRPKPFLFGRCLSVEPVLIDATNNVFQFSAYGPIQAVNALYERAASFGASVGDYASYSALVAASIPNGRWATCLAQGLVRLGAPPAGVITGDVDGDKPSTWLRKTGEIINRIATNAGVAAGSIDSASLTALDTALTSLLPTNQGRIGLYLAEQATVLDVARRLARPCNAQAGISWEGKLFVTRVAIGTPQLTLDAQGRRTPGVLSSVEADVPPPYWRVEMGAERCWRVHSLQEISFYAELIDRGPYSSSATYREGNIVQNQDSSWLYINPTATSGNAPPTLPTTENSYWRVMAKVGPAGAPGSSGLSSTQVRIYRRSATSPTLPSATTTYTFGTGVLTGLNNSWTQTPPAADGNPLWVSVAAATGSSATDTIAAGEWVSPVIDTGAGLNAATVFLYQRTASTTPPSGPASTLTYTFATGALTGTLGSWSIDLPTSGGEYRWRIQATALGTGTTDTIASGEWSAPVIMTEDGDPGTPGSNGLNNATVELWQRNFTGVAPAVPAVTLTYTFATALLSGGSLNNWTQTIPADSAGTYLFKTTAVASGSDATDTIASGEWATPRLAAQTSVDENSLVIYDPWLYTSVAELDRAWTTLLGSGTVSSISDALTPGGQATTITGQRRLVANAMLAYDPNYLWEFTVEAEATSGSPALYGGVAGRLANRTTLVNTAGSNSHDQQHYAAVAGSVPPTVWQSYIGYFTGKGTSGFSFPSQDPLSPSKMYDTSAFVSPIVYPSEGGGTTAIGYVRLRRLDRVPMWRTGGTALVLRDQFAQQNGISDFAGVVYTPLVSASGARVSAIIPASATKFEIGLTTETTPSAATQTPWAIRGNADGQLDLYKNGSLAQDNIATYTAGTKVEVSHDGSKFQFRKDDALIGTPDTTSPGGALKGKVRLGAGSSLREMTAILAGTAGESGYTVSPPSITYTIASHANGTVKAGEFPKSFTIVVTQQGVDFSNDPSVTYTWSNPSGLDASMGGTNNKVFTANSMSVGIVTGTITVTRNGSTIQTIYVTFQKAYDGYGSTPLGDDTLSINNTSSYLSSPQGGPVTRTCGPGNVNIDVNHPYQATGATGFLAGKIQYRTTPGSGAWTDIGAEEQDPFGALPGEPSVLSFSRAVAGPSSAENWEFQYLNRRYSGGGTLSTNGTDDVMTVSGTGT